MRGSSAARSWVLVHSAAEGTGGLAAEVGEGEMAAPAAASSLVFFGGWKMPRDDPSEAWLARAARLRSSKVIMLIRCLPSLTVPNVIELPIAS